MTAPPIPDAPTSRTAAAAIGAGRYYPGTPCKYGHHTQGRYTTTGNCVTCTADRNAGFTRAALNRRKGALATGLVPLTVLVHPADADTVRDLCDALAAGRVGGG